MKPSRFEYHRADSVTDALSRLDGDEDAKPLAGGQSLLAVMNLRLSRPSTVVDLNGLPELDRIFADDDSLVIGARCTHRRVETDPVVQRRLPLLREAATHVGHVAIRNQGTIGGSVVHADPAAEFPAVLLALDATLYVDVHPGTRREIAAADFFVSFYTTSLQPGELLTWIRIPTVAPNTGWGFHEIARRHGDFASAGAVALVRTDGERVIGSRCVVFGVADRALVFDDPGRLTSIEPDDHKGWIAGVEEAAQQITTALDPPDQPELRRRHARHALAVALDQARTRTQRRVAA